MLLRICCALLLASSVSLAWAADAWMPERRTIEYPWMSVARWNQMHDGFLKRAKEGPVDVLFLGDSITEGWGGAGREVWAERYAKLNAANFGIGGDKTQQVLWRITEGAELEGIAPKACVLMIGTNNFGLGGEQPENVVKGVRTIVETLRTKQPQMKILLLAIFPRGEKPDNDFRKKISAVNAELAKLADGKAVVYQDLGPKFLTEDGKLTKEIMPDFLHLSPAGYKIWADAIAENLEQLLKG